MRKAAGIILITLGILVVFGIRHFLIHDPGFVFFLGLVAAAAFHITGGIFCLRRKYWRVCLASASFAVLFSVFFLVLFYVWIWVVISVLSPFPWEAWSDYIFTGWPIGVMLVAAVIAVIFILRTKKEWQETSDIMDGKVSYGG